MYLKSGISVVFFLIITSVISVSNCIELSTKDSIENDLRFVSNIPNEIDTSFFDGEWLLAYSRATCSIGDTLDPMFDKLADDTHLKNLKFAKITMFPFGPSDDYPMVIHIKDGAMRVYEGQLVYDQLVEYVKKNESWPLLEDHCTESPVSDFSSEVFSFIRGTLALAALLLLFAWTIDLWSRHKDRANHFQKITEQAETEKSDQVLEEQTEDTNFTADNSQSMDLPDLIDIMEMTGKSQTSQINSIDEENREEENSIDEIPSNSENLTTPKKLNPFESSNESLAKSRSILSQINQIRETVLVGPIERTASQIAFIQATKIEKSSISELSPKKAKLAKSKPQRTGDSKHAKPKIFKVDEIKVEAPKEQEAITMEAKLQRKQETIIVEPVVEETVTLQQINENISSTKNDTSETKC